MISEDYEAFRHRAVHALTDLNEDCDQKLRIGHWERWDYDLDAGTLSFSEEGVLKVIAHIQVVGTTSTASKTWLWGWANESLPSCVTTRLSEVREFGNIEGLPRLTNAGLPDDEYLGWEMTAIAAQIIGAKGAYRCPSDQGFLYVVYTDVEAAGIDSVNGLTASPSDRTIKCETHGAGQMTYVCEHLAEDPKQQWFSDVPGSSNPWPDAWCAQCERVYQEQGQWNDKNIGRTNIKLLCHRCYESFRIQDPTGWTGPLN